MRIDLFPAAREDLREIWRFGALNWSIGQADRYSDELDAAISSLTENPRRHRAQLDWAAECADWFSGPTSRFIA